MLCKKASQVHQTFSYRFTFYHLCEGSGYEVNMKFPHFNFLHYQSRENPMKRCLLRGKGLLVPFDSQQERTISALKCLYKGSFR
jgi:hypothetical protein